jgi:pilus assembly protein CpaB
MPRRLLAATAAVLLAAVGAFVLIGYVNGADARARADEDLVPVLVVDTGVTAGTPTGDVAGSVSVEQVPRRLVVEGALTDLSEMEGMVTNAALLPGEQLLGGRFTDPAALADPGTVAAPEGKVEVSVTVDAQRAVGGAVQAGDKVGVQLTNQESADSGLAAYSVYRVFHDVLVTRVTAPADASDPSASYVVTLALSPADASVVVLGTTSQSVWLTLEEPAVLPAPGSESDTTNTVTLGGDQ